MSKTHRSNEPLKRHHWKSARTERRARLAHAMDILQNGMDYAEVPAEAEYFLDTREEDLTFRRPDAWTSFSHGRRTFDAEGMRPVTGWNTADKSRLRWKLEQGELPPRRADELKERLNIRQDT